MSLHPTMTNDEVEYIISSIEDLARNHAEWSLDYRYNSKTNEFEYIHKDFIKTNR